MTANSIEIEKMKLVVCSMISKELLKDGIALQQPALEVMKDITSDLVRFYFTTLLSTHKEGIYGFVFYATWWQWARTEILPSWWLKKHPSKMDTKATVECMAAYPTLIIGGEKHHATLFFRNLKTL